MTGLFDEYCVACHADAASARWMILEGWLIPGFPDRSPVYQVIAAPDAAHADRVWPGDDDVLRVCNYVDRQGGFECTAEGLSELRRTLN